MVFSSVIFLLFFLPVFLLLYAVCPRRGRNALLLALSLFFYTWGEGMLVAVMLSSTVVDYYCGLVIGRERDRALSRGLPERARTHGQRLALGTSLVFNLTLLSVFKYFDFAVDNFNAVMSAVGADGLVATHVMELALPLGISFYTFQSLSYTIDCYRGVVNPARNLVDFACFVTMFPQLVAGPIVRYRDVENELIQRTVNRSEFAIGVRQFVVGLGKKMLIANVVAEAVDAIWALPPGHVTVLIAWTGGILFTLQLYYDFAGYSDMAIGLGRMLGFKFPMNFNYPFIARTVTEFWKRWHMTLSFWLRDYLFVSLGGYRRGRLRAYLNLLIVFTLCGLWHGANWNYILFGFDMGALIVFERMIGANRRWFFTHRVSHIYMVPLIVVHMIIFRSESPQTLGLFLGALVGIGDPVPGHPPLGYLWSHELTLALIVGLVGSAPVIPRINQWWENRIARAGTNGIRLGWALSREVAILAACIGILALCALKLAAGTYNPFIYFRF